MIIQVQTYKKCFIHGMNYIDQCPRCLNAEVLRHIDEKRHLDIDALKRALRRAAVASVNEGVYKTAIQGKEKV